MATFAEKGYGSSKHYLSVPVLVVLVFVLFSWLLPNHYLPWLAAYQEFASFLAALLIVAICILRGSVRSTPIITAFFILAAVPLLQFFGGIIYFSGDAWVAAFYLAGFAAMLFAGYNIAIEKSSRIVLVRLIAGVLAVGAVLSVWIALRQWLLLPGSIWVVDMAQGGRPFANFAQPNNLATLLSMSIAGVVYFYERKELSSAIAGIFTLFLIFGVALTQSRTPWLSSLVFAFLWWWKSSLYRPRLRLGVFLCWLLVYFICVALLPFISDALLLSSSDPLERAKSMERWGMWVQFWNAIVNGPLWGYGWNQVSVAQVAISLASPLPLMTEHSHNFFLDMLIWNGPVLGGAAIFALFIWLFLLAGAVRSLEGIYALTALCFLGVHAMLEFPLEYAFFLFPAGLLFGIASADRRSHREFLVPRLAVIVCLLICVAVFGWIWREYRIIEEDHRLMRFESARIGFLKSELPAPDVLVLSQLREFIRYARTEPRQGMTDDELDWMHKISHRYPYAPALFRYAVALALNNRADEACKQMLIIRALHTQAQYQEGVEALEALQAEYPQVLAVLSLLRRS